MDLLTSMRVFCRVVDSGSFIKAATIERMSAAMASKHVSELEARMGASLLARTTRKVRLTPSGAVYYERCREALRAVDEAMHSVARQAQSVDGLLRITAPAEFGNLHVAPLVSGLLRDHPGLDVSLSFTNRVLDLLDEDVDVALRVAVAVDSNLAGRHLTTSRLLVVASPDYLGRHGNPADPADLTSHPALCFGIGDWRLWQFTRAGRTQQVQVRPRMTSTSSESLRQAALNGAGLALLPSFLVGGDVRAGHLVEVLPQWACPHLSVFVLLAQRRHHPARVRLFIDQLVQHFGEDPRADPFLPRGGTQLSSRSQGL